MGIFRKNTLFPSNRVFDLPLEAISPNPNQPRTDFSPAALQSLAESISLHGILQPLTVRRWGEGFQLISGERRLRAARLAGLETVPCLIAQVEEEGSALLALVENLQRRDLDFLEEALALSQLVASFRLTQEEVARRLGLSQSAVANKLRLLRLSPDALTLLRSGGCGERHGRALLKLPEEDQPGAAQYVAAHGLTVRETEQYVARQLAARQRATVKPGGKFALRDLRLFLNSLNKNLRLVRDAGIPAHCEKEETEGEIRLTITLPKAI